MGYLGGSNYLSRAGREVCGDYLVSRFCTVVVIACVGASAADAAVVVETQGSKVTIRGTNQPETIVIEEVGNELEVYVNSVLLQVVPTPRSLKVLMLGGDDRCENRTNVRSFLLGGPGNDTLIGGTNNDIIRGQRGNDYLMGHEGEDILTGGSDNDYLVGGALNKDNEFYDTAGNTLQGDKGVDIAIGSADIDQMLFQDGEKDYIRPVGGEDNMLLDDDDEVRFDSGVCPFRINLNSAGTRLTVLGTSAPDKVIVEQIADELFVYDGYTGVLCDSVIMPDPASFLLIVDTGDESDLINAKVSITTRIYAGRGSDVVFGGSGNDYIRGGQGRDFLYGLSGADVITGGRGNDYISSLDWSGNDTAGDTLIGGLGHDSIIGSAFRDRINSADGRSDHVFPNGGNDLLFTDEFDFLEN